MSQMTAKGDDRLEIPPRPPTFKLIAPLVAAGFLLVLVSFGLGIYFSAQTEFPLGSNPGDLQDFATFRAWYFPAGIVGIAIMITGISVAFGGGLLASVRARMQLLKEDLPKLIKSLEDSKE